MPENDSASLLFFFFPLLIEVPKTQPLGSPHDPVLSWPGTLSKRKKLSLLSSCNLKIWEGKWWESRALYKGTHHISRSIFCLAADERRGLKTLWYLFCPSNFSVCFVGRRISDPTGNWDALSAAKPPLSPAVTDTPAHPATYTRIQPIFSCPLYMHLETWNKIQRKLWEEAFGFQLLPGRSAVGPHEYSFAHCFIRFPGSPL